MIIFKKDIEVENKRVTIYQDSDTHIGSEGHDEALHRRFVDRVKADPCGWWIHTGDMIDEDRPSTREKRHLIMYDRPDAIDSEDKRRMDWIDRIVVPRYKPIGDRCLGILDGDHYCHFRNGTTSGQYIARAIGAPYLGERMGYVSIVFRMGTHPIRYDILARHGKGSACTPGGDMNSLMRQNVRWEADLLLGGHTHGQIAHCEPVVGLNATRDDLRQKIRHFVRGGSFLRGYAVGKQLYPEAAEYSPLCLGWGQVDLYFGYTRGNGGHLSIVESRGSVSVG